MPVHCSDQGHLGLCFSYAPALAYGSCRASDESTTLGTSNLHNSLAPIINPSTWLINSTKSRVSECVMIPAKFVSLWNLTGVSAGSCRVAWQIAKRCTRTRSPQSPKFRDISPHIHPLSAYRSSVWLIQLSLIWHDKRRTDAHSSLSRVSHLLCTA